PDLPRGRAADRGPGRLRHRGHRENDGADRRRDGGPDGRVGRGLDHLRHGQGGRQGYGHRRRPPREEEQVKIVVAIYSDFSSWCIPEVQVQRLRDQFPQHTFTRADSDEETLRAIPPADVAFSSRITPAHLAAAFCLRWIHSPAAGVGAMLFPEMVSSSVVMTNSRGNSSVTIAEHSLAVTLSLFRDLPLAQRRQAERVWAQNEFDAGASIRTLRGARVLVVGLGSIGSETARLAVAFGAEVVGLRRRPELDGPDGMVSVLSPDALHHELPRADVVVLAAPQTSGT